MESKDLWVELKPDNPSSMVLRGTYGEKIHKAFGMTRQGVRWRFWRLLNDIYVSAFETILLVEKSFGSQLRDYALRISRERYGIRQEVSQASFRPASEIAQADKVERDVKRRGGSVREEGTE